MSPSSKVVVLAYPGLDEGVSRLRAVSATGNANTARHVLEATSSSVRAVETSPRQKASVRQD